MDRSTARAHMRQAIDAMLQSEAERRPDGKVTPLVGALLVFPNGTVQSAHRGELRSGDHAEYTLIERKNGGTDLRDAVLFATLEPCAPGARNPPKLACADRILHARISEVWVGVEDPDPQVDGKGIAFLMANGVKVELFDSDLQEEIRSANKAFVEQALVRADDSKNAFTAAVSAQGLGEPLVGSSLESLDTAVLDEFLLTMSVPEGWSSEQGRQQLTRTQILGGPKEDSAPTRNGLILFGAGAHPPVMDARIVATFTDHLGRESIEEFAPPMIRAIRRADEWIRRMYREPIDRTNAQRRPLDDTFYRLVREGIANAVIHRDYSITGTKIQIRADDRKVEISSPGRPPAPITVQDLASLRAPQLSRNPTLHYVASRMGLAEERGLGLSSMRSAAEDALLPRPTYKYAEPYLSLTVYRSAVSLVLDVEDVQGKPINELTASVITLLAGRSEMSRADISGQLGSDPRAIQRVLERLVNEGTVVRRGAARATRYALTNHST